MISELYDEVDRITRKIRELDPTGPEYQKALEALNGMSELIRAEREQTERFNAEAAKLKMESEKIQNEKTRAEAEAKAEKRGFIANIILKTAEIGSWLGFKVWSFKTGLEFEETGHVPTSFTFKRNLSEKDNIPKI